VSLDQLLHALERQAAEAAGTELEAARMEASRIEREAEDGLARRMRTGLEEEEAVLRAEAERTIAEARRSERRRVLEAREQLLDRIFARAGELLVADQDGSRMDRLAEEVRRALGYLGDVPAVVHCAARMAPRLRTRLGRLDGLTVQPDPSLRAGFTVRAADGSVRVDHTPERRLAALRPRLAIGLLRRVEPPS
jgi:vacuolar-type H+-ATPase subunit E/Vma4